MNSLVKGHKKWLMAILLLPLAAIVPQPYAAEPTAAVTTPETVVLLHGLARSSRSMLAMQQALQQAGYRVCNISYPSRLYPVATLVDNYVMPSIMACVGHNQAATPMHVVTHSMGAILLRTLEKSHPTVAIAHVVMLAPPNQGSQVVDKIGNWAPVQWLNGPAGQQLGTRASDLPAGLGATQMAVGVIAGSRSVNWLLSRLIPGADDGKVAVSHTKIEGMRDWVVVPVSHTFIMKNPQVIALTLRYLRTGCFTATTCTALK